MWRNPKSSLGEHSPTSSENVTRRSGIDGNGSFGSDPMSYHAIRDELASRTRTCVIQGYTPKLALADRVADAMRQVSRSAVGLSTRDAQLIRDIRDRGRYIGGVLRALEISRRCADPSDATALPDAFRGFIVAEHPGFSVNEIAADRAETAANGEFDLAVLEWKLSPTRATGERAIEAGRRQQLRTQQMVDAIERAVVQGVRF